MRNIIEIIFLSLASFFFALFFVISATSDVHPSYFKFQHWYETKTKPHIAICGKDTILFGSQVTIDTIKRTSSNDAYFVEGKLGPLNNFNFSLCDITPPRANAMKLLDPETRLGQFDRATYVFMSEQDTIYLQYRLIGPGFMEGLAYDIDIFIPGSPFLLGQWGINPDIQTALDLIRRVVYHNPVRQIMFNPILSEECGR